MTMHGPDGQPAPVTPVTPRKGGEKPHWTVDQMADALRDTVGVKTAAARRLGCDRLTVERYCRKHPTLQAICDEQKEVRLDLAESSLIKATHAGEAWAVCFLLKCQGKERGYFETMRNEHTGKDGAAIEIIHGQLTDDERAARVASLLDTARARRARPAASSGEGATDL